MEGWQLGHGWKVAMDGHFTANYPTAYSFYDSIWQIQRGWSDRLDEHGVELAVVLPVAPVFGYRTEFPAALMKHPRWKLVGSENDGALIFARLKPGESRNGNREWAAYWGVVEGLAKKVAVSPVGEDNRGRALSTVAEARLEMQNIPLSKGDDR